MDLAFVVLRETDVEQPNQPTELTARTDATGRFEMLGIKPAAYHVFAHTADRASPETRVTLADNQSQEVRLSVQDAGIAGVVVDTNGQPVAEAEVRVGSDLVSGDVTDSRGRFDLGAFPPGEYRLTATSQAGLKSDQLVRTGNRGVTLVLPVPGALTGRVLLDGKPMEHYGIRVVGDAASVRDADGRFKIRGIPPGRLRIVLAGPGTLRKTIPGVEVRPGEIVDLGSIEMDHGQQITGHVRDPAGNPVPGARVMIGFREREPEPLQRWFEGSFETTTDADGAYLFDGVDPFRVPNGRPSPICATHPQYGASIAIPVPSGDVSLDLVLVPTGAIEGVVVGCTSAFASVSAQRRGEPADVRIARVGSTGEFHFDAVPPGDYAITMMVILPRNAQVAPPTTVAVAANECITVKLVVP